MNTERIEFDDVEIDKANGISYNKVTGEIIDSKIDIIEILSEKKKKEQIDRAKKREMMKNVGLDSNEEAHRKNWKKNSNFIKHYRTEKRSYMSTIEMSPDEGLLLLHLENYIEFQTNRIAKPCGISFKNKELQEITGMGRDRVELALNGLEEGKFIKRTGYGKAREIYYNPYLMCSGNVIEKKTVELFSAYVNITAF